MINSNKNVRQRIGIKFRWVLRGHKTKATKDANRYKKYLKRAKHKGYDTIAKRFHCDPEYRNTMTATGWTSETTDWADELAAETTEFKRMSRKERKEAGMWQQKVFDESFADGKNKAERAEFSGGGKNTQRVKWNPTKDWNKGWKDYDSQAWNESNASSSWNSQRWTTNDWWSWKGQK